jgi:two-component system, NarL family, invasion response regulator UvrY
MKNSKHTIGLVDDHVILRSALADLINTIPGYHVILQASNGAEMMQLLSKKKQPEIIMLDINMPKMDGFETCISLTQKYPRIKILAFSMHSEEAVILKMIRSGAMGYLLKSADATEMSLAFEALLDNQHYLSDGISKILLQGLQSEPPAEDVELNEKETEFLKLICLELSHKEIGTRMRLSKRTVDYYRDALFRKLNTNTRVGLVKYAIKKNLI